MWRSAHRLKNLAVIPIPLLIAIIIVLVLVSPTQVFEPPFLLPLLNTLFLSIIPFTVAYLAWRSYTVSGTISILFMGCGMLAFGFGALIAGFVIGLPGAANLNVTIFNTSSLFGAILHTIGATLSLKGSSPQKAPTHRKLYLWLSYLAILVFVSLFVLAAIRGLIPPFFVQGVGPTVLRQIVLGSAAALFGVSSIVFMIIYSRSKSNYIYWYSLALALITVGLCAVFLQKGVGSLIGWTGRTSQYLGCIYLLVGILSVFRMSRIKHLPVEEEIARLFKNAETNYRILIQTATDAIISIDNINRILSWNPAAEKILGFTEQEALGAQVDELIFQRESGEQYNAEIKRLRETSAQLSQGVTKEIVATRKGGETFPAEFSMAARNISGTWFSTIILRDITERKKAEEALRSSEERFRLLYERAPLAYQSLDADGCFIDVNQAWLNTMGYSREEVIGRWFGDFLSPHEIEAFKKRFTEFKARGEVEAEVEIVKKDGSNTITVINGRIGYDEQGHFKQTHCILTDITERKRMDEALRKSEQKYRLLADNASDIIWTMDMNLQFTYMSPSVLQVRGYTVEEVMAQSLEEVLTPSSLEIVFKAFAEELALESMEPKDLSRVRTLELEHIRKDGSTVWVEINASFIRDAYGQPVGILGVSRDITDRRKFEESLRQSEEKYRTILKEIADSYFEVDLAGNITFANDATCRNLGYPKEELIGMNYRSFTNEENVESVYRVYDAIFRTGKPNEGFLWKFVRKNGNDGFADVSASLLRSQGGEIIGFRGVGRDITERKMAEEERKQLELKAQATSRLASVGEMAAGVAHEINNPLTSVIGFAQLLMRREDIPSEIRSDLAVINDGAQRVAGIVKRLLVFSRQTKPQRKLVDINYLIESTLALRDYHFSVNNIKVITQLAPDVPQTVVDPGHLQQVLLNLIVNAETEMKLAHGKGRLTITTEKSDNTIKICVKDNGPGIKPEVMDMIFDPFFTTREVGQGTGLGLSLCYGIVTEHKGKIYAESQPGKGATFVVELPIVTEAEPLKPAEPVVKKPQKASKARILVVDDEKVIRDLVKLVLADEGHEVDTVDNAADALKKIKSQKYKLILVDIKMPGISGVDLYKRIQKIDKSLARKVVFITGDIMGADTEKFLYETKVARIDKPFDVEQLSREVQRALSGGR